MDFQRSYGPIMDILFFVFSFFPQEKTKKRKKISTFFVGKNEKTKKISTFFVFRMEGRDGERG